MGSSNLLDGLSKEEREAVLDILREMSRTGKSDKMDNIMLEDWREIPVDMKTFLHDRNYLGKGLYDAEGRFTLFPYWEELLCNLYPDPTKPAVCNTLALTGAIGLGKTLVAVIIGLYELYIMLCLKDPYVFYGLQPIDKITFIFINITLDDAKGVAWSKLQNLVQSSPWFMSNGILSKADSPEWSPFPEKKIELVTGSLPRHFIGRAVKFAFMDEISFQNNKDVNKQIEKAKALVNEASSRMKSRFMKGDVNPTILVLASSKRTEQSYMETFISEKKLHESKTTIVVDEPQWVIRTDKDSKNKFKVAIGSKFLASEILPLNVTEYEEQYYRDKGFRIIEVPMGYYEEFLADIENALQTVAGISTSAITSYISGERLTTCKTDSFENPFTQDIIEIGDDPNDTNQYSDYFDLSKVDPKMKRKPLFIHLDMSLGGDRKKGTNSGDKTGIAGVWIKGKTPPKPDQPANKDLYFQLAFVVSVKATRGHQISFNKTRSFIYWLKKNGFNIKGVTTDTYARAGVEQDLIAKGFNYDILSVDVTKDNVCEPYSFLKSTIYDQRILIPRKGTKLLTDEIIGLKRDNNSGKIDHDPSGINSKDSADAVCGALYNASQHGEEYAHDFGESADILADFNLELGVGDIGEINQQLSEEIFKNNHHKERSIEQNYLDFGYGQSVPVSDLLDISDGIMCF